MARLTASPPSCWELRGEDAPVSELLVEAGLGDLLITGRLLKGYGLGKLKPPCEVTEA